MKRLEELGISPAPWREHDGDVVNANDLGVVYSYDSSYLEKEDARLIAAAPELYDVLQRIMELRDEQIDNFKEWRERLNKTMEDAEKALVKAAGEEVVND